MEAVEPELQVAYGQHLPYPQNKGLQSTTLKTASTVFTWFHLSGDFLN